MNIKKRKLIPYCYSMPFLILMVLFMIFPFVLNLILSFTNYSLSRTTTSFIGIQNYYQAFSGSTLADATKNTFVFTAGCLTLSMLLGLFYAIGMSFDIKGNSVIKALILLPWILPESVTAYVWQWVFTADSGIIHTAMVNIGLITADTSFFADGNLAMWMIITSNAWRTAPFVAIMLYAKLKSIPNDQIEAAKIDGANAWNCFLHITIPWLMPIIKRCCMLLFVWSFNSFTIIFIMTYGGPAGATTTLPFLIRQTAIKDFNFGKAMALAILVLLIICISLGVFFLIGRGFKALYRRRRYYS